MIKAIVEMSKGTRYKYEARDGKLVLDRPIQVAISQNYGFIPNTLCEDGDPIDVFIVSTEPLPPLSEVSLELFGVIECLDSGKSDPKLLAFIKNDEISKQAFPEEYLLERCQHFLATYKTGVLITRAELDPDLAHQILRLSQENFLKE
jgi:inorganic pyrophosphatase